MLLINMAVGILSVKRVIAEFILAWFTEVQLIPESLLIRCFLILLATADCCVCTLLHVSIESDLGAYAA